MTVSWQHCRDPTGHVEFACRKTRAGVASAMAGSARMAAKANFIERSVLGTSYGL